MFRVTGEHENVFQYESGGHRWQAIPPNERGGRVHTSTVTVAVLPEPTQQDLIIPPGDLEGWATRGSGPGGQNRNKVESVIMARHTQSGTLVRGEVERSQHQNRELAMKVLRAKLYDRQQAAVSQGRNADRRDQIGSGQRGDKIRTIRVRDNIVIDHRTGNKMRLDRYQQGELPS